MSQLTDLVKEINEGLTQRSASQKDEQRYMKTMLNDREYVADQYSRGEVIGQVCPAQEARDFLASAMATAAKIPAAEAKDLADAHEFKNSEASNMIAISKSFVDGYLQTGRKLPLYGSMGVALTQKHVEATQRPYPKRIGVDESGNPIYGNGISEVAEHNTIRVHNN